MSALRTSRLNRPSAIAVAVGAILAMMTAVAPNAEATKPEQILHAEVRSVDPVSCDVMIETRLNSRGPMKNDIRVTVDDHAGAQIFQVIVPADRGATLRVEEALAGFGSYTGVVETVNPRTGRTVQVVNLGDFHCGGF